MSDQRDDVQRPVNRAAAVVALFEACIELEPDRRAEHIAVAAVDDDVRREVARLVAAHGRTGAFLETPAASLESPIRFGSWRVVRPIGSGGMGEVHEVQRETGGFTQRAALKLVRRDAVDEDLRRRFRLERQVLAQLAHPGIARLIDGGETDDGRPYLVMEYVDGERIDRWCDERRLDVRRRVELFLRVCDAVTAAHRALVVHRDLKPGNVLVTADGAPRLLDFGIARLLETDQAATATVRALTPRYASPEQMAGAPVSVGADVYALGVMLHELLVGRHPHEGATTSPAALGRAVAETDPAPPSAAALETSNDAAAMRGGDPRRLARSLRGDLDRIVLTALHRDPARRYPSVEALADDLRHWHSGQPIRARPDTAGYRLSRFVGRHRVATTVVALAALSVAAALVASLVALREARRQLERTQGIFAFVTEDILAAGDPAGLGPDRTMREVLDVAAADVDRRFADSPDLAAGVHALLGRAYRRLGRADDAVRHLGLAERLAQASTPDGRTVVAGAAVERAALLLDAGRFDDAVSALRDALVLAEAALGPDHPSVTTGMDELGQALLRAGRHDEAEQVLADALARATRHGGAESREAIAIRGDFNRVLHASGRVVEAERAMQEDLGLRRRVFGEAHMETIAAANNLGLLLVELDRHDEAEEMLTEAWGGAQRILGPEHRSPLTIRNNLGLLAFRRGDFAEAESILGELFEIHVRIDGPDHADTLRARQGAALAALNQGRHAEAIAEFEPVLAARRRVLGPTHPQTLNTIYNLGMAHQLAGDQPRALVLLMEALSLQRDALGPTHPSTLTTLGNVVELHLRAGRFIEAEPLAIEFRDGVTKTMPPGHAMHEAAVRRLAQARDGLGGEGLPAP